MEDVLNYAWLIPASPLVGFCLLVLFGRRLGEPLAGILATLASLGAFIATVIMFFGLRALPAEERFHIETLFEWIGSGSFSVDAGLLIDPLSITMCLFVTGVGTLIHLYSIGYMHGDASYSRFFIYLNLFILFMLCLVLGDNLLITFLGWEGVGACSYLLISYYFSSESNASAGKKAFLSNRVGDFGYLLAAFLVFGAIGSINYDDIAANAGGMPVRTATLVVILFLFAATGKSAQLPLFVWLPDAMAGPTPVSALIHAATMVTSGVFLLIRLNPILDVAEPWSTDAIAIVGAATALFAATIAVAQNDIKKVLAYSTVSQLGYLFLAVGVGAYVAAIFHMITHAFFKALLFLGSGSVIHGLDHEQDMRRMGGIKKFMPVTAFTFIIGWLAIAGVPPFAGFWSKDEILLYAWDSGGLLGPTLWAVGLLTALLTAFYMTRQVLLTFYGRTRYFDAHADEIDQAWQTEIATASEGLNEAEASREKVMAEVDKAQGDVAKKQEALTKAQTKLTEAADAVAGSGEGDDGHDKLVKALDKAEKAVPKAEDAIAKAEDKVAEVIASTGEFDEAIKDATGRVDELERARRSADYPATRVTALTKAPDISAIEDSLPASYQHRLENEPHESPSTMTTPLIVLAGLAAVGGLLNLPFSPDLHFLGHWLEPSLFGNEAHVSASTTTKWVLAIIAVACAIIAIAAAVGVYLRGRSDTSAIENETFASGWHYDQALANFFGGPGRRLFDAMAWFDRNIIDGAVRGLAASFSEAGRSLAPLQSGLVRGYAALTSIGAVLVMAYFLGRMFW